MTLEHLYMRRPSVTAGTAIEHLYANLVHLHRMLYITHMTIKMPVETDLMDDYAIYKWTMKTARKHKGEYGIRKKLAILTTRSEDTINSWLSGRRKVLEPRAAPLVPRLPGGQKLITWEDMSDVMLAMAQAVTTAVAYQLRSIKRIEKQIIIAEQAGKVTVQGRWEHQLTHTATGIGSNATGLMKAVAAGQQGQGDAGSELGKQIAEYEKELSDGE